MADETYAPKSLFSTVQRKATLGVRVTDEIEKMIVDRKLQQGERLPPERELAARFGVSRTVIREATRALIAKGLLQAHTAGGTVVKRPSAESIAQSISFFLQSGQSHLDYTKVNDVRRLLEVEIAGQAAAQRTESDLDTIQAILEDAAQRIDDDDHDHFAQIDIAFHTALAHATQNELFALLLDSLADIMYKVRVTGFAIGETPRRALAYHRAIYAQILAGDVEAARAAMSAHLDESEETQRQVLTLRQAPHTASSDGVTKP